MNGRRERIGLLLFAPPFFSEPTQKARFALREDVGSIEFERCRAHFHAVCAGMGIDGLPCGGQVDTALMRRWEAERVRRTGRRCQCCSLGLGPSPFMFRMESVGIGFLPQLKPAVLIGGR